MIFVKENSHFGSEINVPVAEGYNDSTGSIRALIDSVTEETKLFESLISLDFKEAYALNNPDHITESELISIKESSVSDMISKVKDFIGKCWEKIKAVFKMFWDMLRTLLTVDNKKLVDKFANEVTKKDLSKMKYKVCKRNTSNKYRARFDSFIKNVNGDIPNDFIFNDSKSNGGNKKLVYLFNQDANSKIDLCEAICDHYLDKISYDDFEKEYEKEAFEPESEKNGLNDSELKDIMKTLTDGSDTIKNLKDTETNINKWYTNANNILKNAETAAKKIKDSNANATTFGTANKQIGMVTDSNDYNNAREELLKAINKFSKVVSAYNDIQLKIVRCRISEEKFAIKQARKVFAAAIRFNPVLVRESNDLIEHVCESSDIDFDMYTESYVF